MNDSSVENSFTDSSFLSDSSQFSESRNKDLDLKNVISGDRVNKGGASIRSGSNGQQYNK